MSYTTEIKNEIAINNKDYRKPEVLAELSGFIRNNGTVDKDKIKIRLFLHQKI